MRLVKKFALSKTERFVVVAFFVYLYSYILHCCINTVISYFCSFIFISYLCTLHFSHTDNYSVC